MTCWLTASLQQWRLQTMCVMRGVEMSRGLSNSPRWALLNWAHCSLTSKYIFRVCKQDVKKITIKKKCGCLKLWCRFIHCLLYSMIFSVWCLVWILSRYSDFQQRCKRHPHWSTTLRTSELSTSFLPTFGCRCDLSCRTRCWYPLLQGSPTCLSLRATSWVQSHAKGNRFATLL